MFIGKLNYPSIPANRHGCRTIGKHDTEVCRLEWNPRTRPLSHSKERSGVFINAAFLVTQGEPAAQRAIRYVKFRQWKLHNRSVGEGVFSVKLSSGTGQTESPPEFAEFAGKGQDKWTVPPIPSRINKVGQVAGRKAGSRLLAAYTLIYSVSSEVIHGSPFGVAYFYSKDAPASVEEFQQSTAHQLEDILVALAHAAAGYLSTFYTHQDMKPAREAEQALFNRLLALEGVDPQ